MFLKVKKCILIAVFIATILSLALADCQINLSKDVSLRPSVALKIGSHLVDLAIDEKTYYVTIFENQDIEMRCQTEFTFPERLRSKHIVGLTCESGTLYTYNRDYQFQYNHEFLCSSQKWNLYELFQGFPWCSSAMTSYLLARPIEVDSFQYLAAICYDTRMLAFKSLYFTIGPHHSGLLHPKTLTDYSAPDLELKHFKQTFVKRSVTENYYDNADIKDWIQYSQYNYSSIIQNSLLLNEFNDELGSILDVVWWPNLRLGNWKRYERALAKQVESQQQSYDILAGVSSVATVPIVESCQTNFTLKELVDDKNNQIPMYIWHYLRSSSNSSDDIAVIGFNSPFYEFYSEEDVVFCPDICQEIPWLKKASATFRYNALGVIFCCTVEDVKLSKRLDGFL